MTYEVAAMIRVTKDISIDEGELEEQFTRASGPGGQHVNKAATAVQLRFDVANSPSLPEDVRKRLLRLAGHRVTDGGVLIIEAERFRSQERNRQDARDRLGEMIRQAARKPRARCKTKPTRASEERRLRAKRYRTRSKRHRQSPSGEEW
jgi:ribosome-associated protein